MISEPQVGLRRIAPTRLLAPVLAFLCGAVAAPVAAGMPSLTPPELVQQSDVICIGTVLSVQKGARESYPTDVFLSGKPYMAPAMKASAELSVEEAIKGGPLPARISMDYLIDDQPARPGRPGTRWIGPIFAWIDHGERALFFLKKGSDGGFHLFAPDNSPPTVWPATGAIPVATGPALTPIRQIMLFLADEMTRGDSRRRLETLDRLQSCGDILQWKLNSALNPLRAWAETLRAQLDEPEAADLEGFVKQRILPALAPLFNSEDPVVRGAALAAAGALQDASVIPQMVEAIHTLPRDRPGPSLESVLSQFRVKESFRLLVPLLKDFGAGVRDSVALALGHMNDRQALPFLIDNLDDTDNDAWRSTATALALITRQGPGGLPTVGVRERVDSFWRAWAVKHADELRKLRADFTAGGGP